jgi:hypothetical protein
MDVNGTLLDFRVIQCFSKVNVGQNIEVGLRFALEAVQFVMMELKG